MPEVWSPTAVALPSMLWSMATSWWATPTASDNGEPMLADAAASIGAAALALAATAPSIGEARCRSPLRLTLTLSRLPSSSDPAVVPPVGTGVSLAAGAPWSIWLFWADVALASPTMPWWIAPPCVASESAAAPGDSTLASTAALIGAAMLALGPTARSIGAALSSARSKLALRSSSDSTSLSGRAVAPSAASSSGVTRSSGRSATVPPSEYEPSWLRYPRRYEDETAQAGAG